MRLLNNRPIHELSISFIPPLLIINLLDQTKEDPVMISTRHVVPTIGKQPTIW